MLFYSLNLIVFIAWFFLKTETISCASFVSYNYKTPGDSCIRRKPGKSDKTCLSLDLYSFKRHILDQETIIKSNYISASSYSSRLHLFGGIFGGDDSSKHESDELALYPKLVTTTTTTGESTDPDMKFDSLYQYITEWSQLFVNDKAGMGLTTPVKIFPSSPSSLSEDDVSSVVKQEGVRIVFQPTQTSYKSKKDEANEQEGGSTKKKKEAAKEGGVEVLVEKLEKGEVQVRAKRCDLDEDTMIKEMSEEAILKQLKKAIAVWKKEQQ